MEPQKQYYDEQGNAIKQYFDEQGNPIASSGQRGAPTSRSNINTKPQGTDLVSPEAKQNIINTLKRVGTNMAVGGAGLAGGEMLAPTLAPLIAQIPGLSGVTPQILSGPLSSVSMAAIQNLMKGNANPTDIGKDALVNEGVNKGMSAVVGAPAAIKRGIQEYNKPGSIVGDFLSQLGATFSQYKGSSVAKFIEDNLAPGTKRAAVAASEAKIPGMISRQLTDIAQNPVSLDDYAYLANKAKTQEAANYYNSARASTIRGNFVNAMAEDPANAAPIYKQVKTTSPIMGPNGPITSVQNQLARTASGPISMDNALIHSKDIVDEITQTPTHDALVNIITDPKYNKLQQTAAKVLLESNAQFDSTGKLISHEPVSFKNAWQYQKDIGNYTANTYDSGQVNYNKTQLNQLYSAINNDVTSSIPQWKKGGNVALGLWNQSKELVKERMEKFFPDQGQQLGDIALSQNQNVKDKWNKLIGDNNALAKSLINPSMPKAAAAGVPVMNPRKELASFKLGDIWDNAMTTNDKGITSFNSAKFFKDFNDVNFAQSEIPSIPSSRDLLYSTGTQDDARRFATAIGQIDPATPSRYLQLKLGLGGGLALGTGLTGYMLTGNAPMSALAGGSIVGLGLTGHQIAKVLINKNSARIMVAMAEGQPLGMPEKFAARMIGNALKGEVVNLYNKSNGSIKGKIGPDGQIQEIQK